LYQTLVASNFDVITSPEIEAAIDKKFGRIGGYYIKRQYALVHLGLTKDANFQASVKNVATLVGLADPTGLLDVWNAFFHPLCSNDFPFPNVAVRDNY
jgi:hypothetical protein